MAKNETGPARDFESLMDEAYLIILSRRPTPAALARTLGIPKRVSDEVVRRLAMDLRRKGFRVAISITESVRTLEIRRLRRTAGKPVRIGPQTLSVRKLPSRRPGLKPEDEIIYARGW